MQWQLKKAKYKSIPTIIDGIRFRSKKEADYYRTLKLAQTMGKLIFFLREVPFQLPGNVIHRIDFVEFWKSGDVRFVEVKGFDHPMGKLKRKQVEALYPIVIEVV